MKEGLAKYVNNRYFEAANALKSKQARRRIVAYVEAYDDIYFWRTVLSPFEDDTRYFEVMLPSKENLTRGKKSALRSLLGEAAFPALADQPVDQPASGLSPLGKDMIACVDADYDYLMQGTNNNSRLLLGSPYVFHTYVYAIENYQCYAPSLHDVCVSVTLNDHRIFDFRDYFARLSEALFPLFVWSVMLYRNGNYPKFTITDLNRVSDPGGFTVQAPEASLQNVRRKANTKLRELQRLFPDAKQEYLAVKESVKALGVTPQTTYLYIQGHHLFDTIVSPILTKVCNLLRQERQNEIYHSQAHKTQKRNEMACYENSLQDVKAMLKKNTAYTASPQFRQLQADIARFLS